MYYGIKSKMVNMMSDAYKRNWITPRDGNISYYDKLNEKLIITPSGVRKQEMIQDDLVCIDIVDGEPDLKGQNVSIEFKMHWLIQKYQNGGAVIHFHPTHVVASMLAQIKLRYIHEYFPELNRFTDVGPCVDAIFPGEDSLAEQTLANIQGHDIVGLKSHGVTSRAPDLVTAFEHIERLDHCCKMALAAGAFKEIRDDKN